jgi:hypothetical protein
MASFEVQIAERKVTKSEAQEFARMNNMMSLETSAKTQAGVQDAFAEMVQKVWILYMACSRSHLIALIFIH